MAKTKRKKISKIAKRYLKILKGKGRGKGEGLTLTAGLTKGQGLVKTDPNISLKPIKNKKSKVYKTIFANQGTKENTMTQNYGYANRPNNKKEKESKLKYPKTTGSFRINPDDTLSSISKMTGKSIKEIMEMNKDITNPNNIRAGAGLKGLGKRSDYADFAKSKEAKPVKTLKNDKPAEKMPKTIDRGGKKITKEEINRKLRAQVNTKRPTTNIFKVKKGESTTKAADAKAKREAAQKKAGRGLTIPGKGEPRKLTSKEKRNRMLARQSFRSAQAMKEGPGREKALERS
jgi:hypothetical protein